MLRVLRTTILAGSIACGVALTGGIGSHHALADSGYHIGPACTAVIADLEGQGLVFGPQVKGECASSWANPQSNSSANTSDSCAAFWVPSGIFLSHGSCVAYLNYWYKTH